MPQVRGKALAEASHARLPRKVEDTIRTLEVERVGGQVEPLDLKSGRVPFFDRAVIGVRKAVDRYDLVAGSD